MCTIQNFLQTMDLHTSRTFIYLDGFFINGNKMSLMLEIIAIRLPETESNRGSLIRVRLDFRKFDQSVRSPGIWFAARFLDVLWT